MTDSRGVEDDPFAILGVSRDCTPSQLKRAYRHLARRYHPDVNPGPEAAAQMSRINLAYDRALRQIERTARIRAFRASTLTVTNQRQPAPPTARTDTPPARAETSTARAETSTARADSPAARAETAPTADAAPKVDVAADIPHVTDTRDSPGAPDSPTIPDTPDTTYVSDEPGAPSAATVTDARDVPSEPQAEPPGSISEMAQPETQEPEPVQIQTQEPAPESEPAPEQTEALAQEQELTEAEALTQGQEQAQPPKRAVLAPSLRRVAPPIRRATHRAAGYAVRRRGQWMSIAAVSAVAALVVLYIAHALQPPVHVSSSSSSSSRSHSGSATADTIQLSGTTSVSWADSGNLVISERPLASFATGMRLNESPQWSSDGTYATVSMSPQNSATNADSTLVVLQGGRELASFAGSSGRWSPVSEQLAVLAAPGAGSVPQLDLVSPATPQSPVVLDQHAGTHLAWSDDGTQIAYSADGQQQLRLASVSHGSHQILVRARGERLVPVGWQSGQIVEIVHHSGAVSLARVNPSGGGATTIADVDDTATESTVAVSRGGVAYVTQPPKRPNVRFYWSAPGQQWQAQVPNIQSVRFLAGWSADGTWMALAPALSGSQASEICLARAPQPGESPPTLWAVHCLRLPGILDGMSWEPQSSVLSYVRSATPGARLELRELRIQSALSRTPGHAIGSPQPGSLGPLALASDFTAVYSLSGYGFDSLTESRRFLILQRFEGDT